MTTAQQSSNNSAESNKTDLEKTKQTCLILIKTDKAGHSNVKPKYIDKNPFETHTEIWWSKSGLAEEGLAEL